MRIPVWSLVLAVSCDGAVYGAGSCTGKGVEIQVLGSGGPEMQDKRASSSYLVWTSGKARVLVDAGGGAALRFGESDARMEDLDAVLFTHLHIDHTADFPALIKSSYFGKRARALPVYGPAGSSEFPATTMFVADLFDRARGTYRYLGDFLRGAEGGYPLQVHDLNLKSDEIKTILNQQGMAISATPVAHGSVPALAWRIEVDGRTIVFSGDTSGENESLRRLARGADVFIAHNAVPEGVTGPARALHMPPSVIGEIAKTAGVRQLVLSHRMLRTLGRESETRKIIAHYYAGALSFADDLDCFH